MTPGLVLNASKTEILSFNNRKETGIMFDFQYMGTNHEVISQVQIKTNGILFQQEMKLTEEINIAKVITAMEKQLRSWSTTQRQ